MPARLLKHKFLAQYEDDFVAGSKYYLTHGRPPIFRLYRVYQYRHDFA